MPSCSAKTDVRKLTPGRSSASSSNRNSPNVATFLVEQRDLGGVILRNADVTLTFTTVRLLFAFVVPWYHHRFTQLWLQEKHSQVQFASKLVHTKLLHGKTDRSDAMNAKTAWQGTIR